jgi:NDP-sugar pyrophosphorylase family protein
MHGFKGSEMIQSMPEIVGLLPAAGTAQRISPLPCSKEIYPIGFRIDERTGQIRPKVVSHHVFDKLRAAGVRTAYVIARSGKWDIPAYFGDGQLVGVDIAYLVISGSLGPPDSLDRAYRFLGGNWVAFAFPDMVFGPDDVFRQLIGRLRETSSAVVLGLYPTEDVRRMDMIDVDETGVVRSIVLKPESTELRFTWTCAVWTPVFTDFLHAFVERVRRTHTAATLRAEYGDDAGGDLSVGVVLRAAVQAGIPVQTVAFPGEAFIDIGTPDHLRTAVMRSIIDT